LIAPPSPSTTLFPYTTLFRSGQPVESASVMLKPGNWATMTDEKGRYTFTDVPFGTYILMVTSLEIQPIETRVVLDRAHQRKNIRSEEHTSELQSRENLVCRLL